MAGLARFSVTADPTGETSVILNGEDVSERVSAVSFDARPGQPPVLTLHHVGASGPIEGEGIVQVLDDGMDQRQAVLTFLDNLDAGQLEQAVLDSMSMASTAQADSMGAGFLAALKRAAGASA